MVLPLATSLRCFFPFFFLQILLSCLQTGLSTFFVLKFFPLLLLSFPSLLYLSLLQQDTYYLSLVLHSQPLVSFHLSPLCHFSLPLSLSFPVSPLCERVRAPGVSGKIDSVGGATQSRPDWGRPSNHCKNETGKLLTDSASPLLERSLAANFFSTATSGAGCAAVLTPGRAVGGGREPGDPYLTAPSHQTEDWPSPGQPTTPPGDTRISIAQCITIYLSILQLISVYYSISQYITTYLSISQYITVYLSILLYTTTFDMSGGGATED